MRALLAHRIAAPEAAADLSMTFASDSLDLIIECSLGTPRRLLTLAHATLEEAALRGHPRALRVDAEAAVRSRGMRVPTTVSSTAATNGTTEVHETEEKPKTRRWPWLRVSQLVSQESLDDLFERNADMRLLERRHREVGASTNDGKARRVGGGFGAESIVPGATAELERGDAPLMRVEVAAAPLTGVIPGAVLGIAIDVYNDGNTPAPESTLQCAVPIEAQYRDGSLRLDGQRSHRARAAFRGRPPDPAPAGRVVEQGHVSAAGAAGRLAAHLAAALAIRRGPGRRDGRDLDQARLADAHRDAGAAPAAGASVLRARGGRARGGRARRGRRERSVGADPAAGPHRRQRPARRRRRCRGRAGAAAASAGRARARAPARTGTGAGTRRRPGGARQPEPAPPAAAVDPAAELRTARYRPIGAAEIGVLERLFAAGAPGPIAHLMTISLLACTQNAAGDDVGHFDAAVRGNGETLGRALVLQRLGKPTAFLINQSQLDGLAADREPRAAAPPARPTLRRDQPPSRHRDGRRTAAFVGPRRDDSLPSRAARARRRSRRRARPRRTGRRRRAQPRVVPCQRGGVARTRLRRIGGPTGRHASRSAGRTRCRRTPAADVVESRPRVSPGGRRILLGIASGGSPTQPFIEALGRLRLPAGVPTLERSVAFGNYIPAQRELIMHDALDGGYDYLFFVDDDIVLPSDALERLLETIEARSADRGRRRALLQPRRGAADRRRRLGLERHLHRVRPGRSRRRRSSPSTASASAARSCASRRRASSRRRTFRRTSTSSARRASRGSATRTICYCERVRKHGYTVRLDARVRCGHYDRQRKIAFPQTWEPDEVTGTARMIVAGPQRPQLVPFDPSAPRIREEHLVADAGLHLRRRVDRLETAVEQARARSGADGLRVGAIASERRQPFADHRMERLQPFQLTVAVLGDPRDALRAWPCARASPS